MEPSSHLGEELILPFKMAVLGEEDYSEYRFSYQRPRHANETLAMWKVLPAKSSDVTPPQNRLQVEWPIQITEHSFHLFPRLPKELRLQIWEEVLPEPRIVQFQLDDPANVVLDGRLADRMMKAWPGSVRQDQLLACCESKAVFKKNYKHLVLIESEKPSKVEFTDDYDLEIIGDWGPGSMLNPKLFDCRRDTLLIGWSDILHFKASDIRFDLSVIQNIAFCPPHVREWSRTLFVRAYKRFWLVLTKEFPAMKDLIMVHDTFYVNFHRHITVNNVPKLLELNRETYVMEHGKNASSMYGSLMSQVLRASMVHELFFEEYGRSISFRSARICSESMNERRYYEVIDLEPVDGRMVREDTTYFTRRPIGPCYGKNIRVYFENDSWIQHCTTGGELLSPYEGIEHMFRERTLHERGEDERQRDMDWACYGGRVELGQNL